jgi:hypothetical protein
MPRQVHLVLGQLVDEVVQRFSRGHPRLLSFPL